jgi:aspartyl-tRNA synthetase
LYVVLFQKKELLNQVIKWAVTHPHTGSRKDYWPHIFNNINEGMPGFAYQLRLNSCKLRWGARRIYSPDLLSVWKNVNHKEAEKGDWFDNLQVVDYLSELNESINGEIEYEYCKTLERLELASLAKKVINLLD